MCGKASFAVLIFFITKLRLSYPGLFNWFGGNFLSVIGKLTAQFYYLPTILPILVKEISSMIHIS